MRNMFVRAGSFAAMALAFALALHASVYAAAPADNAAWTGIRSAMFGAREILDGAGKLVLEAPYRADDASTVPISVRMPADFAKGVKSLTLVIDQNPSPVVATFSYGEAAGAGERVLATRVRIDQYSNVRAIAETTDGRLYMAYRFVKASGGCSAPASKDAEEAAKTMGKMRIKTAFKDPNGAPIQEAEVMVKHPNNSGLQMDQVTGLYTPVHFVNKIEVQHRSEARLHNDRRHLHERKPKLPLQLSRQPVGRDERPRRRLEWQGLHRKLHAEPVLIRDDRNTA